MFQIYYKSFILYHPSFVSVQLFLGTIVVIVHSTALHVHSQEQLKYLVKEFEQGS